MTYGWTLDKNLWKRLLDVVGKHAWRKVLFTRLEKDEVPECCGVYVFCTAPALTGDLDSKHLLRALFNAVYVGQTTNLRQRFNEHWRKPMPPMSAVRACFSATLEFWFTVLNSEDDLWLVESTLIECLGPAANRQKGPVLKGKITVGQPA